MLRPFLLSSLSLSCLIITLPRASPLAHQSIARRIGLLGEPKSGTSWLEILVFEASRQLCTADKRCEFFGHEAARSLTMNQDGELAVFSLGKHGEKHSIPLHGGTFPNSAKGSCSHPGYLPQAPPCLIKRHAFPEAGPNLKELTKCATNCLAMLNYSTHAKANSATQRVKPGFAKQTYLLILRDPRDEAVSACFYARFKRVANSTQELATCLKEVFPLYNLWTRYREVFFSPDAYRAKTGTTVELFHYEKLLRCPQRELARLVGILGLQANSTSELDNVHLSTTAESLKVSTTYNMQHQENTGPKIRQAGKKTFLDYGLPQDLIKWMNDSASAMGFEVNDDNGTSSSPSPCDRSDYLVS